MTPLLRAAKLARKHRKAIFQDGDAVDRRSDGPVRCCVREPRGVVLSDKPRCFKIVNRNVRRKCCKFDRVVQNLSEQIANGAGRRPLAETHGLHGSKQLREERRRKADDVFGLAARLARERQIPFNSSLNDPGRILHRWRAPSQALASCIATPT